VRPTVWLAVRIRTELGDNAFHDWVAGIVEPLDGWIDEWGPENANALH
jgi:hypothetical protein